MPRLQKHNPLAALPAAEREQRKALRDPVLKRDMTDIDAEIDKLKDMGDVRRYLKNLTRVVRALASQPRR
jgi:hypothetical protein